VGAAAARLVADRHTWTARMRDLEALLGAGIARRSVSAADAALAYGTAAAWAAIRGLVEPTAGVAAAAAHLRTALDAGSAEAAIGLAELLACAGRDAAALAALAEARRREPSLLLAWTLAAELARRAGRSEEAAALLRDGLAAARGLAPATRAHALASIDAGDAHRLRALATALREEGHPVVLGLHRALDSGLPRTAYEYLERAVRTDPTARDAVADGAALLDWLGLPEFAARWWERLLALTPADAAARAGLVRALRACHRAAEAALVEAGATPRLPEPHAAPATATQPC
jgi:hypothetical protein